MLINCTSCIERLGGEKLVRILQGNEQQNYCQRAKEEGGRHLGQTNQVSLRLEILKGMMILRNPHERKAFLQNFHTLDQNQFQ